MSKESVVRAIGEFYLESRDFNGIPVCTLFERVDVSDETLVSTLRELVSEGRVTILNEESGNPHILRFDPPEIAWQLAAMNNLSPHSCF